MKKIILLLLIVAGAGISSYAQDSSAVYKRAKPAGRAYAERSKQMEQLNLTQDQKDKFKKINEDARMKREKIMSDKSLSDAQKKEQLSQLMKENKAARESLLTPDQQAKMKDINSKRKARALQRK